MAAFLRVPEEKVMALVEGDLIPAQKIDGDWRFLKRAVVGWLNFGPRFHREYRRFSPPWILDDPFWEDWLRDLERRILEKVPAQNCPASEAGTKKAVLKHFGVFKDDADLDDQLASLRARREASGQ